MALGIIYSVPKKNPEKLPLIVIAKFIAVDIGISDKKPNTLT